MTCTQLIQKATFRFQSTQHGGAILRQDPVEGPADSPLQRFVPIRDMARQNEPIIGSYHTSTDTLTVNEREMQPSPYMGMLATLKGSKALLIRARNSTSYVGSPDPR